MMLRRLCAVLAALVSGSGLVSVAGDAVKLRADASIYQDAQGTSLLRPEGLAVRGGVLAVADTGRGRLVVYDATKEKPVAKAAYTVAEIPFPIGVAIAPGGDLVVLDGKQRKIGRVSANGEFKGLIKLDAPGDLVPRAIRVDPEGRLYILDIASARVVVAGLDGKLLHECGLPTDAAAYSDLAVDRRGTIYVVDSRNRRVLVAGKDATQFAPLGDGVADKLEFPTAILVDDRGFLLLADQSGGTIAALGLDGTVRGVQAGFGWKDGFLRYPSAMSVDEKGILFVADRENNRVQVFRLDE